MIFNTVAHSSINYNYYVEFKSTVVVSFISNDFLFMPRSLLRI